MTMPLALGKVSGMEVRQMPGTKPGEEMERALAQAWRAGPSSVRLSHFAPKTGEVGSSQRRLDAEPPGGPADAKLKVPLKEAPVPEAEEESWVRVQMPFRPPERPVEGMEVA